VNVFKLCNIGIVLILMIFSQLACAESPTDYHPKILSTKSGLHYMTGGIGEEDAGAIRAQAKNFTLNLLFSEGTSGRWVTDLNVNIYNEQSESVFRIVGSKPMLYVNLPAGIYTILANNNGQKLRHKFTVEEGVNQRIILNWKDSLIEEDMPLDGEGN
jgi:hypothetical protein